MPCPQRGRPCAPSGLAPPPTQRGARSPEIRTAQPGTGERATAVNNAAQADASPRGFPRVLLNVMYEGAWACFPPRKGQWSGLGLIRSGWQPVWLERAAGAGLRGPGPPGGGLAGTQSRAAEPAESAETVDPAEKAPQQPWARREF